MPFAPRPCIRPRPIGAAGLVLAAALALVASGCSGGGNGGSPPAGGAATTAAPGGGSTGTPSDAGAPGPDDQRLQSIVLSAADLPVGWGAHPSASTPVTEAAASLALAQCLGRRNIGVDLVASVVSPEFSKGTLVIMSSARSYLSDDDVAVATASFANPKASTCYEAALAAPSTANQKPVVKVMPGPAGGPDNVVATATITTVSTSAVILTPQTVKPVKGTTKTTTKPAAKPNGLTGTMVFIAGPRLTVEIDFYGVGEEVPASLRADLINKVAARAAKG